MLKQIDSSTTKRICLLSRTDTELDNAKEKLSKADSSSSDTDEDTPHKRKKPITHADKPSEEVGSFSSRFPFKPLINSHPHSFTGRGAHGGEAGGSQCQSEASVSYRLSALHYDTIRASAALGHRWTRSGHRLVSLDHRPPAAGVPNGKSSTHAIYLHIYAFLILATLSPTASRTGAEI